jgi:hypothetical protein
MKSTDLSRISFLQAWDERYDCAQPAMERAGGCALANAETVNAPDTAELARDVPFSPSRSNDHKSASPVCAEPPAYFAEALMDAERLLKYAAESGIAIDDATRDHVLHARTALSAGWSEETAANLITALTTLAALAKPVTAASLGACSDQSRSAVRTYLWVALWLAVLIVPFSLASFLASAISTAIRSDIATANDLAIKLRTQLGAPQPATPSSSSSSRAPCTVPAGASATVPAAPLRAGLDPSEVITELQQYATAIRAIDGRARQLNMLVLRIERDPCAGIRKNPLELHKVFQMPPGLPNLAQAADDRSTVFQDVRYFAQNVLEDVSFFYGAVTTCILPVLYALLGTCAYLLRSFEQGMCARTFTPSDANSARFLIAAIGGAVVGLFSNSAITQRASIPPLAIAFLVGYAVDVFFAFLEGLLQTFTRFAR